MGRLYEMRCHEFLRPSPVCQDVCPRDRYTDTVFPIYLKSSYIILLVTISFSLTSPNLCSVPHPLHLHKTCYCSWCDNEFNKGTWDRQIDGKSDGGINQLKSEISVLFILQNQISIRDNPVKINYQFIP